MFVLAWIRKIYKVLSADSSPSAIAFAVAFGLTAGFLPLRSGFALLMILSVLVFRVQVSTALLAWGLGRLIAAAGGVAFFDRLGEGLLYAASLEGFWTWALNLPVVAWFGFDCPAILGGAVTGVILGAGLFVPVRLLVIAYRRWAHEKLSQNRFFRWLTSFWLVKVLRFIFIGARA
jgi:uncharacterized protein (TIGR03546 family)